MRILQSGIRSLKALGVSAGFFLLLLAPRLSEACAVCSAGREDETRTAFIVSTAGMTLLPLVLVGGLIWWIRRRILGAESAELTEGRSEGLS